MKIIPDRSDVARFAADYKRVPVAGVISSKGIEPSDCFLRLKRLSRQCFILESMEDEKDTGRYTFIGYDPQMGITCKDGKLVIRGGADIEMEVDDPGPYISKVINDNISPRIPYFPPFTGGLAGYFSYDYVKYSEPSINLGEAGDTSFPDVDIMLFDKLIAFDRLEEQIYIIVNIQTDAVNENYNKAMGEIDHISGIISNGEKACPEKLKLLSERKPMFGKELYCDMVRKAKRYIQDGDIFQVVLSNRIEYSAEGSLFDSYCIMREANPSPYMFYFSSDDIEIAGAAPETLVRLRDKTVTTFPLAGTRGRGRTPEEDAIFEKELLADEKEMAEHNMLVDLGRNDIGRISRFGSVKVDNYAAIEKFSHVMHIGSTVSGEICGDKDAMSAIASLLPAGTLSGAPKIRACQIIGELEGQRRGIYGGAIGYIGFTGDMDTCIAIRIAYKKKDKVFICSGAGIVADSIPENEYEECRRKLGAVIEALEGGVK